MRQEEFSKCRLQISSMLLSAFNQAHPCCCCSRCLKLKKLIKWCKAQEGGEVTDKTFSQRGQFRLGDLAAFLLSGTILLLYMCQLRLSNKQMDSEDSSITGGVNLRAWGWKYQFHLPWSEQLDSKVDFSKDEPKWISYCCAERRRCTFSKAKW